MPKYLTSDLRLSLNIFKLNKVLFSPLFLQFSYDIKQKSDEKMLCQSYKNKKNRPVCLLREVYIRYSRFLGKKQRTITVKKKNSELLPDQLSRWENGIATPHDWKHPMRIITIICIKRNYWRLVHVRCSAINVIVITIQILFSIPPPLPTSGTGLGKLSWLEKQLCPVFFHHYLSGNIFLKSSMFLFLWKILFYETQCDFIHQSCIHISLIWDY